MSSEDFTILSTTRVHGGTLTRFRKGSDVLGCAMTAAIFVPTSSSSTPTSGFPVLLYLSGLTCTDENVCQKGTEMMRACNQHQIVLVCPDTSPRNTGTPGESDHGWDFGVGAGFYLDATQDPWKNHFKMYSYIVNELPKVVGEHFGQFADLSRMSITGHSMGGHGALTIALKNPNAFKSVSAFAPICNPMNCPWGLKAFQGYLGEDKTTWENYDACMLVSKTAGNSNGASDDGSITKFDDILIDVGLADNFYKQGQLLPENFQQACQAANQKVTLRYQDGYDHSYYFISSFAADHVAFHAERLRR